MKLKLSKLSWGTENCTAPGRQCRLPEVQLSWAHFPHLKPSFTPLCQFIQPFCNRKWLSTGRLWARSWKQTLMTLWYLTDKLVHGNYLHTHLEVISQLSQLGSRQLQLSLTMSNTAVWVSNNVFRVCIMEASIPSVSKKMTKNTVVFFTSVSLWRKKKKCSCLNHFKKHSIFQTKELA